MTNLYINENVTNYITEFMENLNNPSRLWQHIFENQLSDFSKNVLITLISFPNVGDLEDLQESFMIFSIKKSKTYMAPIPSAYDFKKSLKELEGNFININKLNERMFISFSNPSVRDFLESYISNNLFEFKALIDSSLFFDQVVTLYNLVPKGFDSSKKPILSFIDELILGIERNFKSNNLNFTFSSFGQINFAVRERESLERRLIFTISIIEELKIENTEILLNELFTIVLELIKSKENSKDNVMYMLRQLSKSKYKYLIETVDCKRILKEYFLSDLDSIEDFEYISEFDEILKIIMPYELEPIKEVFKDVHKGEIKELMEEEDTNYISDYINSLEDIESFLSIDMESSIDKLKDRIDELEYQNIEFSDYDDYTHDNEPYERDTEYDLISNLFDSLKE